MIKRILKKLIILIPFLLSPVITLAIEPFNQFAYSDPKTPYIRYFLFSFLNLQIINIVLKLVVASIFLFITKFTEKIKILFRILVINIVSFLIFFIANLNPLYDVSSYDDMYINKPFPNVYEIYYIFLIVIETLLIIFEAEFIYKFCKKYQMTRKLSYILSFNMNILSIFFILPLFRNFVGSGFIEVF